MGKLTVTKELVTILGGEPSAWFVDHLIDAEAATHFVLVLVMYVFVHLDSIVSSEDSFDSTYIFTDFHVSYLSSNCHRHPFHHLSCI